MPDPDLPVISVDSAQNPKMVCLGVYLPCQLAGHPDTKKHDSKGWISPLKTITSFQEKDRLRKYEDLIACTEIKNRTLLASRSKIIQVARCCPTLGAPVLAGARIQQAFADANAPRGGGTVQRLPTVLRRTVNPGAVPLFPWALGDLKATTLDH